MKERGAVTVVVAAILAGAIVLSLGAADVAKVFRVAAEAQTAADASALAAAQELALPSGDAPEEVARSFSGLNGATLIGCGCPDGSREASVEVRIPVGPLLLFADDRIVVASAKAVVDLPGG